MSRMPIVEAFAIVHRQSVAKVQHFLQICKENTQKMHFFTATNTQSRRVHRATHAFRLQR